MPSVPDKYSIAQKLNAYTRYERLAELMARYHKSREIVDEQGAAQGTLVWFGHRLIEELGDKTYIDEKGNEKPVLPKQYFMGDDVLRQVVGRDWSRIRQKFRVNTVANLQVIRERDTIELEEMADNLKAEIDSGKLTPAAKRDYIEVWLKVLERKARLIGEDMPTRQAIATLEIPWNKFSNEELDRIERGENPLVILAEKEANQQDGIDDKKLQLALGVEDIEEGEFYGQTE